MIDSGEPPDRLRIEVNGQPFTEYFFKDVPRPYYYPVLGPDGLAMTRNWPMKSPPDEEHDHPHHRSLWFAHGSVNGKDFWSEEKHFGKTVHAGFTRIKSGKSVGVIQSKDKWIDADCRAPRRSWRRPVRATTVSAGKGANAMAIANRRRPRGAAA